MFEYDPELLFALPEPVGHQTVDDRNRQLGEEIAKRYRVRPNRARFASFIENPFDPHRRVKEFLGGAEAEVVTGRKTQFEKFVCDPPYVAGSVITVDDKQPVGSGRVLSDAQAVGRTSRAGALRDRSWSTARAPSRTGWPRCRRSCSGAGILPAYSRLWGLLQRGEVGGLRGRPWP